MSLIAPELEADGQVQEILDKSDWNLADVIKLRELWRHPDYEGYVIPFLSAEWFASSEENSQLWVYTWQLIENLDSLLGIDGPKITTDDQIDALESLVRHLLGEMDENKDIDKHTAAYIRSKFNPLSLRFLGENNALYLKLVLGDIACYLADYLEKSEEGQLTDEDVYLLELLVSNSKTFLE